MKVQKYSKKGRGQVGREVQNTGAQINAKFPSGSGSEWFLNMCYYSEPHHNDLTPQNTTFEMTLN